MNPLELRALLYVALTNREGTAYGDVSVVRLISPAPGGPVRLKVVAPSLPVGTTREYEITIREV